MSSTRSISFLNSATKKSVVYCSLMNPVMSGGAEEMKDQVSVIRYFGLQVVAEGLAGRDLNVKLGESESQKFFEWALQARVIFTLFFCEHHDGITPCAGNRQPTRIASA